MWENPKDHLKIRSSQKVKLFNSDIHCENVLQTRETSEFLMIVP